MPCTPSGKKAGNNSGKWNLGNENYYDVELVLIGLKMGIVTLNSIMQ